MLVTAIATPSSHAFQTCSSNSAPDRRASLVVHSVGDVRRRDVMGTADRQITQLVGIDRMSRMSLAGSGFAVQRVDADADHHGAHPLTDRGQADGSADVAVLSLDAGSGGKPDGAGIRGRGVAFDGGAVPLGLGPEPAEAGAARPREERCGHRAVAEAGIPGDCLAGKAEQGGDLLGQRDGAAQ